MWTHFRMLFFYETKTIKLLSIRSKQSTTKNNITRKKEINHKIKWFGNWRIMTEQISDWSCNQVSILIKVTEANNFSLPFKQTLIHMCIRLFMYPALACQVLDAINDPVDRITRNFFSEEIKIKSLTFVLQNYPLDRSSYHSSFAPNIWQQRDNINSELS